MRASARWLQFLRNGARAVLAAAVVAVAFLLAAIPLLLAWLWRIIERLRQEGWRPDQEEEQKDCRVPFPEDLMRRPDPCIYSQFYLTAQGIPVTWDNPDIWVAKAATPGTVEPDSYNLEEDTDYIVFVQVHNAGADLALGVRVRLVYRPWSFNSPDLVPVETDTSGDEAFRTINVAPMGSTVTSFKWRTPKVEVGGSAHYCLQAILSHPMDTNTGNNLGQENTQVLDTAGQSARIVIPLHNPGREARRFTITATTYAIEEKETVELRLKYNCGRRPQDAVGRVLDYVPRMAFDATPVPGGAFAIPGVAWPGQKSVVKAKYVGMENVRDRLLKQDVSLPAGFDFDIADYDNGITLAAEETRDIEITLTPPPGTPPGTRHSINILARGESGWLAGGATIRLNVKG